MALSKEKLPVLEEFITVQGEGVNLGLPYYFIRVGGCPLRCHNCDSEYTWKLDKDSIVNVSDVATRAVDACKANNIEWVSITGGEPMLYPKQMMALMYQFHQADIKVHIETSGRFHHAEVHMQCDIYSVDAKTPCTKEEMPSKLLGKEWLRPEDQVKCLIWNWNDLNFAHELNKELDGKCSMILQPFNDKPKESDIDSIRLTIGHSYQELLRMFHRSQRMNYKWMNTLLTPQVHVLAYGNKPGV